MIVQCLECKKYYDDEFRNALCRHDPFLANDGRNNFKLYPESFISNEPLGESKSYQEWLNENKIADLAERYTQET